MEYMVANLDWLEERLKPLQDKCALFALFSTIGDHYPPPPPTPHPSHLTPVIAWCRYVLFDCPGQVELYTHHDAMVSLTA
jgi:hypothetical protein